MNLRPDEKAALRHIETAKQGESFIKKGIGLALPAAAGIAGASRIMPFLNSIIPQSIALKGLKKVAPKIGQFIDKTMENGFSADNVLGFLRDQFSSKEEKISPKTEENPQNQPENKNQESAQDFENNYPMLAKALMETIQQGKNPQEAAKILKSSTALGSQVRDLEKQKGKKFEDYVIEMLGNAQKSMGQQGQQQAQPEHMQQPAQQPQQQSQPAQQPQPQQAQGGVDPQLLQLVQGLRNSIKGMRGG